MMYEMLCIPLNDGTATMPQHDDDSACGDSVASSTTSLRSAVTNYEYEHGRRYHAYKSGRERET